jgi:hypothetical protein
MPKFRFTLILRGIDAIQPEHIDALLEAGCDDAIFGSRDRVPFAEFAREAPSLPAAITSAIESIESAVPGARVIRVAPDDLVNLTEIAARTGRTKESVRLYSEGRRGPGGFPPPVVWVAGRNRVWQWSDVARWFDEELGEVHQETDASEFVAAFNGALEVRWRGARLATAEERAQVVKVLREELVALSAAGD